MMRIVKERWLTVLLMLLGATVGPVAHGALAQADQPAVPRERTQNLPGEPGITPAEIQRMLDGYALMQAQEMLQIGDDQFPQFLPRLRALQDARRRVQTERIGILRELRRMTEARGGGTDEAHMRERIRALDELDARSDGEVRQAREALDQVLDPYQQARFRIFEEMMERRKVELLMRARQANRQPNRPRDRSIP